LELQFHLSCPPERAFRAFTDKVDLWWPKGHRSRPDARMDFEPGDGGRLVERYAAGERTIGEVKSWQPPNRLAFDWRLGIANHPTRVEISFAPTDSGTDVTVLHTPADAEADGIWPNKVALFEKGWTASLTALADFISSQKDLE
jgi:uncharacterized protein YndB with AHSA1/START domain